jgi:hypothetical protein
LDQEKVPTAHLQYAAHDLPLPNGAAAASIIMIKLDTITEFCFFPTIMMRIKAWRPIAELISVGMTSKK